MVAEMLQKYIFYYIKFFLFKEIYLYLIKMYYYYSKEIFNQNILMLNNEIYIQYFYFILFIQQKYLCKKLFNENYFYYIIFSPMAKSALS